MAEPVLPKIQIFHVLTSIGTFLSIVVSLGLVIVLRSKKSNYSRIMRHILMSESIFIFAEYAIVTAQSQPDFTNIVCKIFNIITFGIFGLTDNSCIEMKIANLSAYYSQQCFSVLLNIFICLEIILILKNPISQLKSRLKPYFVASTFTALLVFFISFSSVERDIEFRCSLTDLFLAHTAIYINFVVYITFVIIGFISLIYLFMRFCFGKPLVDNLKNFFVIRHFIYVILYMLCLLPNKINEFMKMIGATSHENYFGLEVGIILNTFMGFIMFLIRVSETNFYSILFCKGKKMKRKNSNLNGTDLSRTMSNAEFSESGIISEKEEQEAFFDKDQPLTAIITRNMNMEFMCCILFGLTEIYLKTERKHKQTLDTTKEENNMTYTFRASTSGAGGGAFLNSSKDLGAKDFNRAKSHKIRYKKIFNDNIDFEELSVEVFSRTSKGEVGNIRVSDASRKDMDSVSGDTTTMLLDGKIDDHDAVVIEYCPRVFRELRKLDDISGYDLERALNPALNKHSMEKMKESEGKSGSFFFFSHDGKFIIKTISNNELNTMLGDFMKNYYEHTSSIPESLLVRIYGLYSIVIKGVSKINIILMQNLMTIKEDHIKRIFDLKGSRVQRITKKIEKCNKMKTLKDLDYLWMIKIEEDMIDFTRDQCDELNIILETDLKMLREVNLMDYSLLFIILHFPKPEDPDYGSIFSLFGDKRYCSRIFKSRNSKYIYILGIIDYLQKFNVAKFFENKYKSLVYGSQVRYVSAVDPMIYADRMFEFARENIFISNTN